MLFAACALKYPTVTPDEFEQGHFVRAYDAAHNG